MKQHLYLIGYRGSGKSTVGRLLAGELGVPFCDTDGEIEAKSGLTIREIFERFGESGFRDLEEDAVRTAAHNAAQVVSLGGGAILRPANRELIVSHGKAVWLRAPADVLYQRIHSDSHSAALRPNLSAKGGYDEVVEILGAREPIYGNLADFTVSVDGRTPDEVMAEILDWVRSSEV